MDLWDLLAIANGTAFVIGGFVGMVAAAQVGSTFTDIVAGGERGAFVALWLGTSWTFVVWGAAQVS